MKRESFNSGWLFCPGSGTALERTINGAQTPIPVTLPHDAMICQERDPQTATGNASGYYPAQTVHYTKEFTWDDLSGFTYLEFEGIYQNAAVYINGCLAAQHQNGYTAFTVDISPFLKESIWSPAAMPEGGIRKTGRCRVLTRLSGIGTRRLWRPES